MDYNPSKVMHKIIMCSQEMNNIYRVKRQSHLRMALIFFLVRLAAHVSNGLKSRIHPVVGRI